MRFKGYSSLPRSCHSAGLDGAGMSDIGGGMPLSSPYCPDNTLPLLETVSEDQEIHARRNNALDDTNTHASANSTTSTCNTTTTSVTTTTTTTTSSSSSSSVTTIKMPIIFPMSTRPQQALYSQRIVIGSEELDGRDIGNVVRQKMCDVLDLKSPKIVRTTAIIVKRSFAPAKPRRVQAPVLLPAATTAAVAVDQRDPARQVPNGDLTRTRLPGSNVDGTVMPHDFENDYYFRDSFDHSSSESQLLDTGSLGTKIGPHGSSRSITPVPKMQRLQNSKIGTVMQASSSSSSGANAAAMPSTSRHRAAAIPAAAVPGSTRLRMRTVRIVKLFIPALMLTITVLFIVTVLVFETDSKLFEGLRKTPEMVALRSQYYTPIKDFLRTKLGLF